MDFNYLELHKASMQICELDHHLQGFLQQLATEYKQLKSRLQELEQENLKLKEELSKK